ncbi:ABC transporter permease [Streptomyces sp. NPDC048623]|uniref:ABC transporter permease n=1 Tax=Streptomyces sp. NPDC048623 TaxID=3155761 RepID=UPI00343E8050
MTGFVLLRARAHRLLLAAALLAVLLTTSVLATLAAFSGSIGDAALQSTLQGRAAPAAALVIKGQIAEDKRASADEAARKGTERTFAGLPVHVRKLAASGPYALPRSLQPPAARAGDPDLTHFAALDRSRISLVRGAWPKAASAKDPAPNGAVIESAVPEEVARRLKIAPGTVLDLADRLGGTPLKTRITGVYRPVDTADLYWQQLDPAGGRGVRTLAFTTYGPLYADPATLASGRVTSGTTSWLGTADYRAVTTEDTDALKVSGAAGPKSVLADTAGFGTTVTATTALPTVLEQTDRALLVSRSTLSIVAVQLVLLAGYALLLVARLLSSERSGETDLLRARGASRRRIAGLAAVEALFLALPAAIAAPLLSGPLTRLVADRSTLDALGAGLGAVPPPTVWLVAAAVALCCAAAVVAPALATGDGAGVSLRKGRSAALPGPVRAGADIGLLIVAGIAYWQLDRQTGDGGGGALAGDRSGSLGVDPLLVAAPALALLAGTVLTLRLMPPAARLAERRAAGGRGLPAALAGWQFSRRPLRGAGPVLLLVLAVAMGMLAIGQRDSWDRSQRDQADFKAGADVRVLSAGPGDLAETERLAAVPGVRTATPVHRAGTDVAGHDATVLAVDTRHAADGLRLRADLADGSPAARFAAVAPKAAGPRPGIALPAGTRGLAVELRDTMPDGAGGTAGRPADPRARSSAATPVTRPVAILEDGYGVPYRRLLGTLPADGRTHRLSVALPELGGSGGSADSGGFSLVGLEIGGTLGEGTGTQRVLTVGGLFSVRDGGTEQPLDVRRALPGWTAEYSARLADGGTPKARVALVAGADGQLTATFRAGSTEVKNRYPRTDDYSLTLTPPRPAAPAQVPALATDAFLTAAKAKKGDVVEVTFNGATLRVRIAEVVRELPTTGPGAGAVAAAAPTTGPQDGGALLVDLFTANRALAATSVTTLPATEWWLATAPGRAADVAKTLRARPDADPAQVLVRDEAAAELLGDPLGAGPNSALMAVAAAAAALAAVGFAVGSAGSLRERSQEFGVLRALGAPRRQLARLIAAEQGLLIGIGLLVGVALGTVLTRAVVPLVVLTSQADRPVPQVLVELPVGHVALLLAGVAVLPLAVVAAIALRRTDPATTLRTQGDH